MREIKFRAWSIKGKTMWYMNKQMKLSIEGDSWQIRDDVIGNRFMCSWHEDEKGILMQFTGLKDKNGKEIHEGDIVSTLEDGNLEVIFQDGMFGCITCRPQSNENGTEYYDEFVPLNDLIDVGYWGSTDGFKKPVFTLEVIGNIYENPELLKEA